MLSRCTKNEHMYMCIYVWFGYKIESGSAKIISFWVSHRNDSNCIEVNLNLGYKLIVFILCSIKILKNSLD